MSEANKKFMVISADDDDETHGGIAFFDTEAEAGAHVESLLEAGLEHDNVSVFAIRALATEVRYRPVVTIVTDGKTANDPKTADDPEAVSA